MQFQENKAHTVSIDNAIFLSANMQPLVDERLPPTGIRNLQLQQRSVGRQQEFYVKLARK